MKRLLALLAAVAMVAVAVIVRGALDDSGGGKTSGPKGTVTIACAEDLTAACTALEGAEGVTVVTEPAATTADALTAAGDPKVDAWLTTNPWTGVVAVQRTFDGLPPVLGGSTVLARSPVVLAVDQDVRAALDDPCAGTVGWVCLGQQTGVARPSHARPDTAIGLVELAAATTSWFEATKRPDFAANDFEDPDFQAWLKTLEALVVKPNPPDLAPLQALFVAPGSYGAVGALEADVARRNLQRIDVLYPRPVVTADVVLVTVRGRKQAPSSAVDAVERALGDAGWRVSGAAPPSIAPAELRTLPGEGLPADAGVLIALRKTWEDVTR